MLPDFLNEPVELAAELMLGCHLEREVDGERSLVRIVETEAYDMDDAASHAYRGQTARNEVMFGESGHLYVYFTYGMHYCCNVVTGEPGHASAVLIRGVEPVEGIEELERRRGASGVNATNGPAKLCQALGVDLEMNGHDLREKPLRLLAGEPRGDESIERSTRIGISKATELPWRFSIAGNGFVSRRPGGRG